MPAAKVVEGDAVAIRCAHGDTVLYPMALVAMVVDGIPLQVEAAVSETLPVSVLMSLSWVTSWGSRLSPRDVPMVTTRAQARRREADEDARTERDETEETRARPITSTDGTADPADPTTSGQTPDEEVEELILGSDFADDLFTAGREKVHLSRQEKRVQRQEHARRKEPEPATPHELDISAEELQRLQEADEILAAIRKATDGEASTAGVGFFKRAGLLYRRWQPPGRDSEGMAVEQLVLPLACRQTVLTLAHTIPLAGHLGRDKTARRILQRFYWPTLFRDTVPSARKQAT